jgi:ethanolamine ammonia-lyase small subunit
MSTNEKNGVVDNPWRRLREFTDARIGLGRTGISLPTAELLAFQLAHAQARDAVHFPLDKDALISALKESDITGHFDILTLHSQADDRMTYLQRPDLGRRLDERSCRLLQNIHPEQPKDYDLAPEYDLAFVIVDGLSSRAVAQNTLAFLEALIPQLSKDASPWRIAPLTIIDQGRVAIGDDVGERLNARAVIVLVGERPGLSSPDSLGLYLTWAPRVGLTDASRNCRPAHTLSTARSAAVKTLWGEPERPHAGRCCGHSVIDEKFFNFLKNSILK